MRYIPIIIVILFGMIAYRLGLSDHLTLDELSKHHAKIQSLVNTHCVLAPLSFIIIYVLFTALALPFDTFLIILGGYIFPQPFSLIYVTISATIGAMILYLSAKYSLGDTFYKWIRPFLNKMEKGFNEEGAYYLLFIRFNPLFPFWLANITPAFFGISIFTYYWTTLIGVIPFAFVFTQIGAGIGTIMESRQSLSMEGVFNLNMKIALVGLGLLSLMPIIFKFLFRNQAKDL